MLWIVAEEAAANWSSRKDSRQGAPLAYYSVFSLGPIIVIAIAVAGLFLVGKMSAVRLPLQSRAWSAIRGQKPSKLCWRTLGGLGKAYWQPSWE